MWLYKCSFWGRSLITLDFADDQTWIFYHLNGFGSKD